MIEEVKAATDVIRSIEDPVMPMTSMPLIYGRPDRLDFAGICDGLHNYIHSEADLLLAPPLAQQVKEWAEKILPLPKKDMINIYAKMEPGSPVITAALSLMPSLFEAYDQCAVINKDTSVPKIVKLIQRFQVLTAAAIILARLSKRLLDTHPATT